MNEQSPCGSREELLQSTQAVMDAFSDNHLSYEQAIHVMACCVKHIGKKCGSQESAAVMMIRDLDKLMPRLKDTL